METRVVHVLSGDLWAGAEVATFHLLRALARRSELEVAAIVLNPGELASRLAAAGVAVEVEPEEGRGFASLVRAVRARLSHADLVHAHRYKEDLLAALSGRPWLATQHGRPEPFGGASAWRMRGYLALDLALKRCSARAVIAVSPEVAEWLRPRVGARRVHVAANGIDPPAGAARAARWRERPLRVGVVSRLVPVKGLELAIDAVAAMPDLELEIVGEGPLREALEARARAHGAAGRIRFVGFEPDPPPRMATWRALLVTSLHEGHPIGVLEAMAVGTPVVSTELRGIAEMLDGRAGWLIPGRDPAAWARALSKIVHEEPAGERAAEAARARFAAEFTADAAAERAVGVYRAALGRTSPR
ncbi:MAG TPA: glycosyltransferase [Myxococcota bacterium]|jgi:glycosyltransferase involved in cell wall biosynthesis|nr:glycosyltransferase [Myxococcota bacterium]